MDTSIKDTLAVVISREGDEDALEAAACVAPAREVHATVPILAVHPRSNWQSGRCKSRMPCMIAKRSLTRVSPT
jgi:hypothetical protein